VALASPDAALRDQGLDQRKHAQERVRAPLLITAIIRDRAIFLLVLEIIIIIIIIIIITIIINLRAGFFVDHICLGILP
jgi:hypothetical protein